MTMKEIIPISFVSGISRNFINEEIANLNDKLSRVQAVLASAGEATLEEASEYQNKGADHKRKAVMQECEDYINRTGMPDYFREDFRKKAWESCPNEYISRLASVMTINKLRFDKDVREVGGKWVISQEIEDAIVQKRTYTLTTEEMEAFGIYEQILELADQLHKRHYYLSDSGLYEDDFEIIEDKAVLAEKFLTYQRSSPEEYERRKQMILP